MHYASRYTKMALLNIRNSLPFWSDHGLRRIEKLEQPMVSIFSQQVEDNTDQRKCQKYDVDWRSEVQWLHTKQPQWQALATTTCRQAAIRAIKFLQGTRK